LERDNAERLDDLDVALVFWGRLPRLFDRFERQRYTLLQIIAKRVIIGADGEIIDQELEPPFAYLRSLVDDFRLSNDGECGSDQHRKGAPKKLSNVNGPTWEY
jgi:hypothetical protein